MELLLPAGNFEKLEVAVENGADAVYLGINKFNARLKAGNFSFEDLNEAVVYCHKNGVKVYVTMNTLVKNQEIKEFFEAVNEIYLANADAIIIQHISFAKIIKDNFPGLNVHLSTQARVQNLKNLKYVDRVILPRELSKEEINEISKIMPVEIFVQGALCFCVSGLCLMSSFIGGRSGNRGFCAQPCRKEYNDEYLMSMKDLSLLKKINEISAVSLKIEGRLRSKEYLKKVALVYRKALDGNEITQNDYEYIKTAFKRELTEGFFSKEENKTSKQNIIFDEIYYEPYNYINNKKPIVIERKYVEFTLPKIEPKNSKEGFYVKVYNLKSIEEANQFDRVKAIFYNIDSENVMEAKKRCKKDFYLVLPTIISDEEIEKYVEKVNKINPKGVIVNSFGFKDKFNSICNYGMNLFNDYDLEFFGKGIISPELNFQELTSFKNKDFLVLVQGNITVMTTKNPLPSSLKYEQYEYKVIKEKDYWKVFNSKQIALLDSIINLKKEGINQFYFDLDKRVTKWLDIYDKILDGEKINIKKISKGFTKGHISRGVY